MGRLRVWGEINWGFPEGKEEEEGEIYRRAGRYFVSLRCGCVQRAGARVTGPGAVPGSLSRTGRKETADADMGAGRAGRIPLAPGFFNLKKNTLFFLRGKTVLALRKNSKILLSQVYCI